VTVEYQMIGLAAAYMVIETVKFLVNHMNNKKTDQIWEACLKLDSARLRETKSNEKIVEKQEKMWDILRDITHTQKDIANILSKILDKLN